MQKKLENTINLVAVMLLVLGLVLVGFVYLTQKRGGELVDAVQLLNERLEKQQAEILQLKKAHPTASVQLDVLNSSPEVSAPGEEVLLPEERREIRTALTMAKSMMQRTQGPDTLLTRLGKASTLLATDRPRALAVFRKEILELDKAGTDRFLIESTLKELERRAPEDIDRELRAFYQSGSLYVQALTAGSLARRGDDSLVQEVLPEIRNRMLKADKFITRLDGVVNLGYTYSPLATPYVIDMLKDENVLVRARAAGVLAQTGGPEAIRELTRVLDDEQASPAVRDEALRSLDTLIRR